jgi:hypothetical protein
MYVYVFLHCCVRLLLNIHSWRPFHSFLRRWVFFPNTMLWMVVNAELDICVLTKCITCMSLTVASISIHIKRVCYLKVVFYFLHVCNKYIWIKFLQRPGRCWSSHSAHRDQNGCNQARSRVSTAICHYQCINDHVLLGPMSTRRRINIRFDYVLFIFWSRTEKLYNGQIFLLVPYTVNHE